MRRRNHLMPPTDPGETGENRRQPTPRGRGQHQQTMASTEEGSARCQSKQSASRVRRSPTCQWSAIGANPPQGDHAGRYLCLARIPKRG